MNEDKQYYTRDHLAQVFDVSKDTIRRWEKSGMPVVKIGNLPRYEYEACYDWLKKMEDTSSGK